MHYVLLYLIECVQKLISLADQPMASPANGIGFKSVSR